MPGDELRRFLETLLPGDAVAEVLRRFEAAKLESLAEFAAGAGHEINNPLAVISGRAAMLLADEADLERRRLLATIGAQALRIRDMIGDLMVFGRPPEPVPAETDLAAVARSVVGRFADEIPPDVRLCVAGDEHAAVWADHTQICAVVEALVRNSLEALNDSPGMIEVQVRSGVRATSNFPADGFSRLIVCDTGRGLTETDREHLFDPFYSGRPAGRGLGFGLSKCWRIVTLHGGRIEIESPACLPPTRAADGGTADPETAAADERPAESWTAFRVLWPAKPASIVTNRGTPREAGR